MKLSINILSWNVCKTLKETLKILDHELKNIASEIIIVDNGSTDGSQFLATICNKENLGISKGKNQCIDASLGEYILLLDGDVVPVPNSIRCLLEYMEGHRDIPALGFHANKWSNQRNKGSEKHHEDYCERIVDVEPSKAHCCYYGLYRREVFRRARFDERYGPGYGYEDLDFFLEMKKHGIIQYVCHINNPAGKYFHDINSSIRVMGRPTYEKSNDERSKMFIAKWGNVTVGETSA
jgi:glycosyltransferase involved in cell wall biosynthesis